MEEKASELEDTVDNEMAKAKVTVVDGQNIDSHVEKYTAEVAKEEAKPKVDEAEVPGILNEYRTYVYADNMFEGMTCLMQRWEETGVHPAPVFEEFLEKLDEPEDVLSWAGIFRGYARGNFKIPERILFPMYKKVLDDADVDGFNVILNATHINPPEEMVQEAYAFLLSKREIMYKIKYLYDYSQVIPSKEVIQAADQAYKEQGKVYERSFLRNMLKYKFPKHRFPDVDFGLE